MGKGWGLKLANLLLGLYGQGLLGGLPAQERQTKQRALEQLADIQAKPTWTALTPGMQYDPAAEKLLPGQRRMDVGQQPYRVPGETPREQLVGPTYGEAGVLSGITSKLPLGQLISAKAGPEMMRPWLGKLMGPEAVEETVGGAMYPTKGLRNLQQYLGLMKEEGVMPEQREGMKDVADIVFGIKEKRKQPSEYTLAPGQKRFKGREEIAAVEKTEAEKARPGVLGQYDEWKKDHPGATFEEYKRSMKEVSLMEAPPSIEDLSGEVRKWMGLEKTLAMGGLDNEMLIAMMATLPEDHPMKEAWASQDLSALQAEATKQREYYQGLLEEAQVKKEYPNAKKDEYGSWVVTIEGKEYVITP